MILDRLLKPRPAKAAGAKLYVSAVAQARSAPLYATMGVRDSLEGRFELFTLHVVLLLERLKAQGDLAAETSQAVFDAYVRGLFDQYAARFEEHLVRDLAYCGPPILKAAPESPPGRFVVWTLDPSGRPGPPAAAEPRCS